MQCVRNNSLTTSDSSKSGFSDSFELADDKQQSVPKKLTSSFLRGGRKSSGGSVRFDLEISSSQHEIPSYDDEDDFIKSQLYYNHDELKIMRDRMNQDIQSFIASTKTVKCRQTLHKVLRHCEDGTSEQRSCKHLVILQKLCKKYELFGDHIIGLERHILGANANGKQQKILASAKAGAFHAIKDITLSSSSFASELAAAQASALTTSATGASAAADKQSKSHRNKGGRAKNSLFNIFKSMRKDDNIFDAKNQCAPPA